MGEVVVRGLVVDDPDDAGDVAAVLVGAWGWTLGGGGGGVGGAGPLAGFLGGGGGGGGGGVGGGPGGAPVVGGGGVMRDASLLPGFLGERNGVVVGLLTYAVSGDEMEVVTVDALERQRGAGSLLIEAAVGKARELGL